MIPPDATSTWSMFRVFKVVVDLSQRFARSANESVAAELDAIRSSAERYKVALEKMDREALIQTHEEYMVHFIEFRDRFLSVLKREQDKRLFGHLSEVQGLEFMARDDALNIRAINSEGELRISTKLKSDLDYSLDVLIGSLKGISDALKSRTAVKKSVSRRGTSATSTAAKKKTAANNKKRA